MEDTAETGVTATGVVITIRTIKTTTREVTTDMSRARVKEVTTEVDITAETSEVTRRGAGVMRVTRDGEGTEEGVGATTERITGETEEITTGEVGGETPETATEIMGMRSIVTEKIRDTTRRTPGPATRLRSRMRTPETQAARVIMSPGRRGRLGLRTWSLVISIES